MKILLVVNKTYHGREDGGHWNLYTPLLNLGHDVEWYDTVAPDFDFQEKVESWRPDLIFCCMTGDPNIAPHEPWEEIRMETETGRTRTFNWFCDDTWRFDSFSKTACRNFNVCSTPEPNYLDKYRSIGYNNIILGCWHVNGGLYFPEMRKDKDVSFIGNMTPSRTAFFSALDIEGIDIVGGVSMENLFAEHSRTKIGINLSKNDNDPAGGTQMKQRPFEIAAGGAMVLTEHHDALSNFFEIDREIVTFKTAHECKAKLTWLIQHPSSAAEIAKNGHERFMREHESHVRLKSVLKEIME